MIANKDHQWFPPFRRCAVAEMVVVLLLLAVKVGAWMGTSFPTPKLNQIIQLTSISSRLRVIRNRNFTCTPLCSERDNVETTAENTGPKNEGTCRNEFSRTIRVNKWFSASAASGAVGGGSLSNNRSSRRVMDLSITASPQERQALATRFRLTKISALTADLVVQALGGGNNAYEGVGSRGRGTYNGECIEARGTVCAQVTQACVRTNEEFDVNLEFSFDTVLRAMSTSSNSASDSNSSLSSQDAAALSAFQIGEEKSSSRSKSRGGKNQRGGRGVKGVRGGRETLSQDLGEKKMKELQDIFMEYEVTDEIIEDESCFCTDGIVDCGEIVAQMFRSKLDPYPKKPGSVSSLRMSIIIMFSPPFFSR
jgi:hypothetical protein